MLFIEKAFGVNSPLLPQMTFKDGACVSWFSKDPILHLCPDNCMFKTMNLVSHHMTPISRTNSI